jgi:hypothetical protein
MDLIISHHLLYEYEYNKKKESRDKNIEEKNNIIIDQTSEIKKSNKRLNQCKLCELCGQNIIWCTCNHIYS